MVRTLACNGGRGAVMAARSTWRIIAARRRLVSSTLLASVVFSGLATDS